MTTGALFPIKSDIKPWIVPPDMKQMSQNLMLTYHHKPWSNAFPLTNDSSDIVPNRQTVGLGLFPAKVAAQIERKPEEEGVVDQLQTGISEGILQHKHGARVNFTKHDLCLFKDLHLQAGLQAVRKPDRSWWSERTRSEALQAAELVGVAWRTPPPPPPRHSSEAGGCPRQSPWGWARSPTNSGLGKKKKKESIHIFVGRKVNTGLIWHT